MTERKRRLEFWFDFASTYSYIAAMRIEALCSQAGVSLQWVPFLLGPIFELQGWNNSPFNLNERRGNYMWRDMERLCAKYSLSWQRPTHFPRSSTLSARVGCIAQKEPWCGAFIRAVFVANFGHDRNIDDRAVLEEILTGLQLPAATIISCALAPENRALLRCNTQRAIELGIFGAPNCFVRGELFWGEESLEDAIDWALHSSPLQS